MREIKFRGKRVDKEEWEFGSLFVDEDLNEYSIQGYDYYYDEGGEQREPYWYKVIPNTIGQYTGLKDKNGKEIYEGDIVKNHMTDGRINSKEKDYMFEVVWCCSEASFEYRTKAYILGNPCCVASNQYRAEVIGNIYENPDLLEVTHED